MLSKKTENRFLELITQTGRKVIKQLGLLFVFSLFFYIYDTYYLNPKCEMNNSLSPEYKKQLWECTLSPIIGGLGENLLQVVILIWFVDIGLKRETIEEIEKIFVHTQSNKHIKGFYLKRKEYKHLIEHSFSSATNQKIKLLCLSGEEGLFQDDNLTVFRNKIIAGCNIEVLILHPDSSLMNCLEGIGFDRELQQTKYNMIKRQLTKLQDTLKQTTDIKGTMEVRVHKDLFSAIGYYSDSKELRVVWMYFSNSHDNEFPAFNINSEELICDADNHFDHLWNKAEKGAEILYISPQTNLNYVSQNNSN